MENAAILAAENSSLWAANEKAKKQRQQKRKYICQERISRSSEVQEIQNQVTIEEVVQNQVIKQVQAPALTHALPRCSGCRSLNHIFNKCPER